MALTRQLLRMAMNRLLGKLNTLLLPRIEAEGCCLEPLPAEILASADLMQWLADELPVSRELFDGESVAQHRNWPNVHDWRGFVKAINELHCPTSESKLEPTSEPEPESEAMAEAVAAFMAARQHLVDESRRMMSVSPGAAAPTKASRTAFLPTDSQRRIYRDHVMAYHREYIVGRDLKHKDLMLHWAAVYQAIADRTGLRGMAFCGPEFDEFVFDYCGIAYNASASRRGRYRSIQDLRARCIDMQQPCPQRQDFNLYRSNMLRLMNSPQLRMAGRMPSDDVPRKLEND